jgi:hypothetical protein
LLVNFGSFNEHNLCGFLRDFTKIIGKRKVVCSEFGNFQYTLFFFKTHITISCDITICVLVHVTMLSSFQHFSTRLSISQKPISCTTLAKTIFLLIMSCPSLNGNYLCSLPLWYFIKGAVDGSLENKKKLFYNF